LVDRSKHFIDHLIDLKYTVTRGGLSFSLGPCISGASEVRNADTGVSVLLCEIDDLVE
jgi:hypothetical protein